MGMIKKPSVCSVKTLQDVEDEFYSEIKRRLLEGLQSSSLDVMSNEMPNVLRRYGHTYFEIGIVAEAIYKIFEKTNEDLLESDADFLYDEKDETLKIIEKLLNQQENGRKQKNHNGV